MEGLLLCHVRCWEAHCDCLTMPCPLLAPFQAALAPELGLAPRCKWLVLPCQEGTQVLPARAWTDDHGCLLAVGVDAGEDHLAHNMVEKHAE